jgi:hypothetical protein
MSMSIDQEREEEILQLAEDRATDDADSLYPLAEEDEAVLLREGQRIAREFDLAGEEAALFAEHYASLYQAEIDCLDQDYQPEDEAERGYIAARRIRLADLDPLAIFRLRTPAAESDYPTYRQARRAYDASRRTHGSALLALVRYLDAGRCYQRDESPLLACGSFKQERR